MRTLSAAPTCLLLAMFVVLGGCKPLGLSKRIGFDLSKNIPWAKDEIEEEPMKVIPIWRDTVMHQQGQAPVRGFGGRIMFYVAEEKKPVKVAGSLEVYAFVENGRDPNNRKPDRKYVFTTEQLSSHYSENRSGHGYSFWLPWDGVDGPTVDVSLIGRFTPENGGMIVSEQTRHRLPGADAAMVPIPDPRAPRPLDSLKQAPPPQPVAVQQASYTNHSPPRQQTSAVAAPTRPRLNTLTIPLGPQRQAQPPSAVMRPQAQLHSVQDSRTAATSAAVGTSPHAATRSTVTTGQAQAAATRFPIGYRPPRSQALGAPLERLDRGHGPLLPSHAKWQSGLADRPQRTSVGGYGAIAPTAAPGRP